MKRSPYKYLDYYSYEDADLFFGREQETLLVVGEIISSKLLVLFSPSGSGKTSLINAGARPKLEEKGYRTVYSRFHEDPNASVKKAIQQAYNLENDTEDSLSSLVKKATKKGDPLVLFIDQFEEFFIVYKDKPELREAFIDQIAQIRYDDSIPVSIVLSMREDYYVSLYEFRDKIPSIFDANTGIRLEPFGDDEAERAIVKPGEEFRYDPDLEDTIDFIYNSDLVDTILADLKTIETNTEGIEPITLQLVCHALWEQTVKDRSAKIDSKNYKIGFKQYNGLLEEQKNKKKKLFEGARKEFANPSQAIISNYLDERIGLIPTRNHKLMAQIFEGLKTKDNTKRYRSFDDINESLRANKSKLSELLKELTDHGLLRHEKRNENDWYEFKHDYLVPEVSKWLEARRARLLRTKIFFGIAPGVLILLALLIYSFVEYSTIYAAKQGEGIDNHRAEIVFKRGFDFCNLLGGIKCNRVIETGIAPFYIEDGDEIAEDLEDLDKQFQSKLGYFKVDQWEGLISHLDTLSRVNNLYALGEKEEAWSYLSSEMRKREDDFEVSDLLEDILRTESNPEYIVDTLFQSSSFEVKMYAVQVASEMEMSRDLMDEALYELYNNGEVEDRYRLLDYLMWNYKEDSFIRAMKDSVLSTNDKRFIEVFFNNLYGLFEQENEGDAQLLIDLIGDKKFGAYKSSIVNTLYGEAFNDQLNLDNLFDIVREGDAYNRGRVSDLLLFKGLRREELTTALLSSSVQLESGLSNWAGVDHQFSSASFEAILQNFSSEDRNLWYHSYNSLAKHDYDVHVFNMIEGYSRLLDDGELAIRTYGSLLMMRALSLNRLSDSNQVEINAYNYVLDVVIDVLFDIYVQNQGNVRDIDRISQVATMSDDWILTEIEGALARFLIKYFLVKEYSSVHTATDSEEKISKILDSETLSEYTTGLLYVMKSIFSSPNEADLSVIESFLGSESLDLKTLSAFIVLLSDPSSSDAIDVLVKQRGYDSDAWGYFDNYLLHKDKVWWGGEHSIGTRYFPRHVYEVALSLNLIRKLSQRSEVVYEAIAKYLVEHDELNEEISASYSALLLFYIGKYNSTTQEVLETLIQRAEDASDRSYPIIVKLAFGETAPDLINDGLAAYYRYGSSYNWQYTLEDIVANAVFEHNLGELTEMQRRSSSGDGVDKTIAKSMRNKSIGALLKLFGNDDSSIRASAKLGIFAKLTGEQRGQVLSDEMIRPRNKTQRIELWNALVEHHRQSESVTSYLQQAAKADSLVSEKNLVSSGDAIDYFIYLAGNLSFPHRLFIDKRVSPKDSVLISEFYWKRSQTALEVEDEIEAIHDLYLGYDYSESILDSIKTSLAINPDKWTGISENKLFGYLLSQ